MLFPTVEAQLEPLILNYNKVAMDHLRSQNYSAALQFLKRAQELLDFPASSSLLAITYNNLGCYYKKTGKNALALQHLNRALALEANSPAEKTNLAGTHLNVCTILSQLGSHEAALQHAQTAISLLREAQHSDCPPNTATTMIIALHSVAVEYELLCKLPKALETFRAALSLALKQLGAKHPLTESLKKSLGAISGGPKVLSRRSCAPNRTEALPKLRPYASSGRPSKSRENKARVRTAAGRKPVELRIQHKLQQLKCELDGLQDKYEELRKINRNRRENEPQHTQILSLTTKPHNRKPPQPQHRGNLETKTHKAIEELEELKKIIEREKLDSQEKRCYDTKPALPALHVNNHSLDVIPETAREDSHSAVLLIQAHMRRHLAQQRYRSMKHSALHIQTAVRGHQCLSLYKLIRSAAVFIQSCWRGFQVRKRLVL